MKNEIKFTPFGKISINFIKNKNIGPQNEGPWAPRMQMVLLSPTNLPEQNRPKPSYFFKRMVNCECENTPSYNLPHLVRFLST